MTKIQIAKVVAKTLHCGQTYDDGDYYDNHLVRVADLVEETLSIEGYESNDLVMQDMVAAAYLHDTVEDTQIKLKLIKEFFGPEVEDIIYRVTDELGRNRNERISATYPKIKGFRKATLIKLADRICNVESSLRNENHGFFKMYQNEYRKFNELLYDPEMILDLNDPIARAVRELWIKLDKLMGG